jgi:cob(I)alamin adenosyltransferase
VYYGRGKGKTTAAVGLAVRAAGSGLNVYFLQFIKGEWPSGERDFFKAFNAIQQHYRGEKKLGTIEVVALGKGFVKILGDRKPFAEHVVAARQALALGRKALRSDQYDLVILDEALSAVETKLLKTSDLLKLVQEKPPPVHLVLTGHDLPKNLFKLADLVSEVKMVKHPYYEGLLAQRGIDY